MRAPHRIAAVTLLLGSVFFSSLSTLLADPPYPDAPKLTAKETRQLQALINQLATKDMRALYLALTELRAMGPKAEGALTKLTMMLDDKRPLDTRSRSVRGTPVNQMVIDVLQNIGQPAVPSFLVALASKDSHIRLRAVEALVYNDLVVEPKHWYRLIYDEDRWIRIHSLRELAKIKGNKSHEALTRLINDKDLEVQLEAIKALGIRGEERAIKPLINCVQGNETDNASFKIWTAAGQALASIGRPAVVELLERYDSFDGNTRKMAHFAIQKCDAKTSKQLLVDSLKSEHGDLREAALYALSKLQTGEVVGMIIRQRNDPDWNVRWRVAHLMGEVANDKNADEIRPLLIKMAGEDRHAKVRDRALWTLYVSPKIPTAEYTQMLLKTMSDPSPRVRATAASSANKFWDDQFAKRLEELLDDKDANVRAEATAALRHSAGATVKLIELLNDNDERVATCASYALAGIGTDKSIRALIAQVNDESKSEKYRNFAVAALCHTKNPLAIETLKKSLRNKLFRTNHLLVSETLKKLEKD